MTPSKHPAYKFVAVAGTALCVYFAIVFLGTLRDAAPGSVACILAFLAVFFTGIYTWKQVKEKEIETLHGKQKAALYEEFIVFIFNFIFAGRSDSIPYSEDELLKRVTHFNVQIMVWGNDGVINAWNGLRRQIIARGTVTLPLAYLNANDFEAMIYAMRRDLGYRDKKIGKGDLLPLFLAADALALVKNNRPAV